MEENISETYSKREALMQSGMNNRMADIMKNDRVNMV
jgi:hypothetical protein